MTVSRVGFAIANGDTLTMPSHQAGDLLLAITYRNNSNTTVNQSGWYRIFTFSGNTNALGAHYKFANSSSESFGTFADQTQVAAIVYRHTDYYLTIGGFAGANGTTDTISYPALGSQFLHQQFVDQWFVGFSGYRANNTSAIAAPTNMTTIGNIQGTSAGSLQVHDTNGLVNTWSAQTVAGSSLTAWRSLVVEIVVSTIPKSAAPPALPTLRGGFSN